MQIEVRVVLNSKNPRVEQISQSSYKAWLDSKPIDNKANLALIKLISDYFNTAKSNVTILQGAKLKNKVIEILDGSKS